MAAASHGLTVDGQPLFRTGHTYLMNLRDNGELMLDRCGHWAASEPTVCKVRLFIGQTTSKLAYQDVKEHRRRQQAQTGARLSGTLGHHVRYWRRCGYEVVFPDGPGELLMWMRVSSVLPNIVIWVDLLGWWLQWCVPPAHPAPAQCSLPPHVAPSAPLPPTASRSRRLGYGC